MAFNVVVGKWRHIVMMYDKSGMANAVLLCVAMQQCANHLFRITFHLYNGIHVFPFLLLDSYNE